jgi:hypothetical protein
VTRAGAAARLHVMDIDDLGPLERAILRALVGGEALGAPALDPATIHRCLPAYATREANVRAALDDPTALGRFVVTDGARYALGDRPQGPARAAAAVERAEQTWRDVAPTLRGLAKLPWIEGLALVGAWALGQSPADGAPVDVALLAEGHRGRAAAAAFGASLRSRGAVAARIRLVQVWDADAELALDDDVARLRLATLRPISHPAGWAWLRARVPDLTDSFPNEPWADGDDGRLLGDRLDGRLAVFRRRVLAGDVEVNTAADRRGRRRILVDRTMAALVQRLAAVEPPGRLPPLDLGARWRDVAAWTFEEPASEAPGAGRGDAPPPAAGVPSTGRGMEQGAVGAAAPAKEEPVRARSRRQRGPQRRPARAASPAASSGRAASRRCSESASSA